MILLLLWDEICLAKLRRKSAKVKENNSSGHGIPYESPGTITKTSKCITCIVNDNKNQRTRKVGTEVLLLNCRRCFMMGVEVNQTYQYQLLDLPLGRVRDSWVTLTIINSIDMEGGQKSNIDHEIANLQPANERVIEFQSITVQQIAKCYRTFTLIAVTMIIIPISDHISNQYT